MKEIRTVIDKMSSYLFHVLAVGKINYDNDYSTRYKHSIKEEDLNFLHKNKHLLMFSNGEQGLLSYLFIFFPGYIGFNNREQLIEYYYLLNEAVKTNDSKNFYLQYQNYFLKQEKWTYKQIEGYIPFLINQIHNQYKNEVERLKDIVINSYDAFDDAWEVEKIQLEEKSNELNILLPKLDLITKWEALTHIDFKFPVYEIILCSSINNGPNANSLGYEKNVFNGLMKTDDMIQMISHEVGTHLLIDLVSEIWDQDKAQLIYSAFESLARFYNQKILQNVSYKMPNFKANDFYEIYDELLKNDVNIKPKDLLTQAIKQMEG